MSDTKISALPAAASSALGATAVFPLDDTNGNTVKATMAQVARQVGSPAFFVDAAPYNAVGDGVTDDTLAIQAAINDAWLVGGDVYFAAKPYRFTKLILPVAGTAGVVNGSVGLIGAGANWLGEEYNANRRYGTRLIQTLADGSDAIAAISTVFSRPTYRFRNLTIVGPDSASPRTTTSGHGLRISGTATAFVRMEQVNLSLFYGTGRAGLWLDNVEVSQFDRIHISACDTDLKLSGATNNCVFNSVALEYAANYGAWLEGSEGGVWNGLLVQHSERSGLHLKGYANAVFNAPYFEGNNTTATGGRKTIELESAVNFSTANVVFLSPTFNGTTEAITAAGVSGWAVDRVRVIGAKGNGFAATAVTIGAFCTAWEINGVCAPTAITDTSGSLTHRVIWNGAQEIVHGRTVTLANNGVQFLGTSIRGFLDVSTDDQEGARFWLKGAGNLTVKIHESAAGIFTITKGTVTSLNCYYDAAGASGAGYYLQNTRGGARDVTWSIARL